MKVLEEQRERRLGLRARLWDNGHSKHRYQASVPLEHYVVSLVHANLFLQWVILTTARCAVQYNCFSPWINVRTVRPNESWILPWQDKTRLSRNTFDDRSDTNVGPNRIRIVGNRSGLSLLYVCRGWRRNRDRNVTFALPEAYTRKFQI